MRDEKGATDKPISLDPGELLGIRQFAKVAVAGSQASDLGRLLNKIGIDENGRGLALGRHLSKIGGAEEDT